MTQIGSKKVKMGHEVSRVLFRESMRMLLSYQ